MLQSKTTLHILSILFILLIGFIAYSNTFSVPFQFDDGRTIVGNAALHQTTDLGRIWRFDPSRFLTHLSFAVNFNFHKTNVLGFHLINLLLHLANGLFVYLFSYLLLISKRLEGGASAFPLFIAAIFVVHPIQTQAVTYIVQRATLLAAFGYLGAMNCYIIFRSNKNAIAYIGAIIFTLIGVFSKPTIVTLPLALLLIEAALLKKSDEKAGKIIMALAPFALVVAFTPVLLALWKYQAINLSSILSVTNESQVYSRSSYLFTQFKVILIYMRLLIVPIGLNLDYDLLLEKNFFSFSVLSGFISIIVLIALSIILWRKQRLVSFGILFFLAALSLESSIFPIKDLIFEHRLYLPVIGFAFVLAQVLSGIFKNARHRKIGAAALVILLGLLTFQRNHLWRDPITLWTDAAKKSPNKSRPHIYLGNAYMDKKDYKNAYKHINRALEINPKSAKSYNNRGLIFLLTERHLDAVRDFKQAILANSRFLDAYSNLGNTYQLLGDFNSAIETYKSALSIYGKHQPSRSNLAVAYYRLGIASSDIKDLNSAIDSYRNALASDPDLGSARNNLAVLLYQQGSYKEAIDQIDEALTRGYKPNPEFLKLLNRHRQ